MPSVVSDSLGSYSAPLSSTLTAIFASMDVDDIGVVSPPGELGFITLERDGQDNVELLLDQITPTAVAVRSV